MTSRIRVLVPKPLEAYAEGFWAELREGGSRDASPSRAAMARGEPMKSLRKILDEYIAVRRALGFKLERAGRLLPDFLTFLECHGAQVITIELALAWVLVSRRRRCSSSTPGAIDLPRTPQSQFHILVSVCGT